MVSGDAFCGWCSLCVLFFFLANIACGETLFGWSKNASADNNPVNAWVAATLSQIQVCLAVFKCLRENGIF